MPGTHNHPRDRCRKSRNLFQLMPISNAYLEGQNDEKSNSFDLNHRLSDSRTCTQIVSAAYRGGAN